MTDDEGTLPLGRLPAHFHLEEALLDGAGIRTWTSLAAQEDRQLRELGRGGGGSEARLIRLRGQARLVVDVGLPPAEAALLLHAGIADGRGLAEADPQRLLVQVGRLRRTLTGTALVPITLTDVRHWILQARRQSGRSGN